MLKIMRDGFYNRDVLIGLPKITLKNFKCQNIVCGKTNQFKKRPHGGYICECGYITLKEHEVEETHKVKLYCGKSPCHIGKTRMDKSCLSCEFIRER